MGLHTKNRDEGGSRTQWVRWAARVPLLPAVVGAGAVGVVAVALSTAQVSLNFTGGPPPECASGNAAGQPAAGDACPTADPSRDRSSDVSRDTARHEPVSVAFRASPRRGGFRGTATITNRTAQKIKTWTFEFHYPDAKIRKVRKAEVVRKGRVVIVRNLPGAQPLAPGASVSVVFRAVGTSERPDRCVFNDRPCRIS